MMVSSYLTMVTVYIHGLLPMTAENPDFCAYGARTSPCSGTNADLTCICFPQSGTLPQVFKQLFSNEVEGDGKIVSGVYLSTDGCRTDCEANWRSIPKRRFVLLLITYTMFPEIGCCTESIGLQTSSAMGEEAVRRQEK